MRKTVFTLLVGLGCFLSVNAQPDTSRLVRVALEGTVNTRDLGNYQTLQNTYLLPGKIFRSEALDQLTSADLQWMVDNRIEVVVDMRGRMEAAMAPNRLPGTAKYLLSPAGSDQIPNLSQLADAIQAPSFLTRMYDTSSVEHFGPRYKPIFDHLLTLPDSAALLFHCTAGRDRTGMAAALLLDLLGVPYHVIENDYLASNLYLSRAHDKIFGRMAVLTGIPVEKIAEHMELKPQYLKAFFDALIYTYGSKENFYQQALGIGPAERAILLNKFTANHPQAKR